MKMRSCSAFYSVWRSIYAIHHRGGIWGGSGCFCEPIS